MCGSCCCLARRQTEHLCGLYLLTSTACADDISATEGKIRMLTIKVDADGRDPTIIIEYKGETRHVLYVGNDAEKRANDDIDRWIRGTHDRGSGDKICDAISSIITNNEPVDLRRTCKDCKHVTSYGTKRRYCVAKAYSSEFSPVTGKRKIVHLTGPLELCESQRRSGICGPSGALFSRKWWKFWK